MQLSKIINPSNLVVTGAILLSVFFVLITSFGAVNYPQAEDDFVLFINRFHRLLKNLSLKNILEYLFAPAFGIHPKLSSRLLGFSSYGIFGIVDFKFLIIISNLCYLFLAHTISDIAVKCYKTPYLRLIILSIFLVPLTLNYRPVFITGFPFHILFAFLCFLSLSKRKIWWSYIFFLLTASNAGGGVFTGLIASAVLFSYFFLFKEKKYLYHSLAYIGIFLGGLFFLLSYKSTATGTEINVGFSAIISYTMYVVVFIQKSVTPYFIAYEAFPSAYIIIGLPMLFFMLYNLLKKFRFTVQSPFYCLSVYIVLQGFLAAIIRGKGTDIFPEVMGRYEHYSVIFMVCFVVLLFAEVSSKRWKIIIAIFFFVVFATRIYTRTIYQSSGFHYGNVLSPSHKRIRSRMASKTYKYLHNFKLENIAQNKTLEKEKRIDNRRYKKSRNIRPRRFANKEEFGVFSFRFKKYGHYKNIRLVLESTKGTYLFKPHRIKRGHYYCLITKNGDLPIGNYIVKVRYSDESNNYEYTYKKGKNFFTIKE